MSGCRCSSQGLGRAIVAIYLDHAATTPARPEAIARLVEVMENEWGNPSSLHGWGERAATVLERARLQVAAAIGGEPEGVVFTSGGTEADNLALLGVAQQFDRPRHAIVSAVEHAAIARPARLLEAQGWQVTALPVDAAGRVRVDRLAAELRPETAIVSVMLAQNEVGTVQPVAKIGALCRAAGVLFHTDAVQALGHIPIDVRALPVDLLSLSSHKVYGPQGVGALYVRPGVRLAPLLRGGGQEGGLRAGTQPIAAIAGFGVAAALAAQEIEIVVPRLAQLRDRLLEKLADVSGLVPTGAYGAMGDRLPHHASFAHERVDGRRIVRAMAAEGIGISAGSACSSGTILPSPVLLAMGYTETQALGAIRLTLGRSTTAEDIDTTAATLRRILVALEP